MALSSRSARPKMTSRRFNAFAPIKKGVKMGGSAIGALHEIKELLELAAEEGVHPWIQQRPLKDPNQADLDMVANKASHRYVLINEIHVK
ncbi:MAG: hypothetical protein M1836_005465 [Candelina mexicana]|nr:MAG: hypothetical protein M1836_005465 [Candelina mexicana]